MDEWTAKDWKRDKHSDYMLEAREMCGRTVLVVPLAQNRHIRCADCGQLAAFIIVEGDGKVWYYCGICDVGG